MADADDPVAKENLRKILASPSYIRAQDDLAFLARPEQRGVRLLLELNKADTVLREENIHSTIVVFGSTHLGPDSPYYKEARELGRLVSSTFQAGGFRDFVISTGGGPGVMEAANRGAYDVGAKSVGFNIVLPEEQVPNPWITPELCFQFHYFGIRKMHLMLRARALVAFPGGFGTLDELFEALTLVQTRKMPRVPIVLVGRDYWEKLVNWKLLVEEKMISPEDFNLIAWAETGAEAWKEIVDFYGRAGAPPVPDRGWQGR
jgi:uncharacterized protein (TIGR00730 family)